MVEYILNLHLQQKVNIASGRRARNREACHDTEKIICICIQNCNYTIFSFLQAENIMLLELDMSPPTMFTLNLNGAHLERAFSPRLMRDLLVNVPIREGTTASSRVRKSQSW